MTPKLPYFPFYNGDWLKDASLCRCSFAAQGVWIRVLSFMYDCQLRGVLKTDGVPWTESETVMVIGGDKDEATAALRELVTKGVCRRSKRTGTYYSRRMIRDERIRRARSRSGTAGGYSKASRSGKSLANRWQKSGEHAGKSLAKGWQNPEDASEVEYVFSENAQSAQKNDSTVSAQAVLEARLGRDATSSDSMKLARFAARLDANPVHRDGVAMPTEDVLIASIRELPVKFTVWHSYVSSVLDTWQHDGMRINESAPVTAEALVLSAKRSITLNGVTVPRSDLGTHSNNIVQKSTKTIFVPSDRLREAQVDRG